MPTPKDPSALRRRLERLHTWNAWLLLFLALSGIVLYLPGLRAPLAPARVPLKWAHILAGIAAFALLLAYIVHLPRHWRQLGRQIGKRLNAALMVGLLLGWAVSGLVVMQDRLFLGWTHTALFWHDLFSWIGLPYVAGHALLRWLKVRLPLPWAGEFRPTATPGAVDPVIAYHRRQAQARRQFLTMAGRYAAVYGGALLGLGWALQRRGLLGEPDPKSFAPEWPEGVARPLPSPQSDPPVGGGAKGAFRFYNVASRLPVFDPAAWRLEVTGLVSRPLSLTWDEVIGLPRTVIVRDFHCVSGWSVYHVTWEGILVSTLLDLAGVLPQATHARFDAYDNAYTDALTLGQARLPDVMVAILKDGLPLGPKEGQPARLIVPPMFAYKSVKWLTRIELIDHPHVGFWEELGYSSDAWLNRNHPDV